MLSMQPIGYVRSPYKDTQEIPKGLGSRHEVEGIFEIRAEYEAGLTDIEGFSHLFVIWAFDRSEGFTLLSTPPSDNRLHGIFAWGNGATKTKITKRTQPRPQPQRGWLLAPPQV
jgi:tRNA (adenine37-N6)-methyltransferase